MSKTGRPSGQKTEPLTLRLHNLLREYRRGLGIFKELIQNADDAGASRVVFTIDNREHPAQRLPDSRMSRLVGPALLCANDKPFSARDREHIEHIGDSSKTKGGPKIGRFGLGFNTVYNITDHPSFLTGNEVVCFDPHCNAVAETQDDPGWSWLLADLWQQYPDWPAVFMPGGIKRGAPEYDGTIFRLPLRRPEHAAASLICQDPFLVEDFQQLLQQLQETGPSILLFTRNVMSLEVRQISSERVRPQCLWRIDTVNREEVQAARAKLPSPDDQEDVAEFLDEWRTTPTELPQASYRHVFAVSTGANSHEEHWHVVNGIFSDPEGKLLNLASELRQDRVVPWAGAAARLAQDDEVIRAQSIAGHFYCGMPLPQLADQPVHLNGYFEIHTNRERITTGDDQGRQVRWNQLLLQHGVAHAYAELLDALRADVGAADPQSWYALWPQGGQLAGHVSTLLADRPVIRVSGKEHSWEKISTVRLPHREWREALQEPLLALGVPLPVPPLSPRVEAALAHARLTIPELTPSQLRQHLRTGKNKRPQKEWIEVLLRFCLSDGQTDLAGLPLALLCTGTVQTFQAEDLWLATEDQIELFPERRERFIEPAFHRELKLKENPSAKLHLLTPELVVRRLHLESESTDRSWALKVLRYLATHKKLVLRDNEDIKKIRLIPDQFGALHSVCFTSTPLLTKEDIPQKLWDALTALKVSLVPVECREVVAAFAAQHRGLVYDLTAADLIDTLDNDDTEWSAGAAEIVIDFLADDATLQRDKPRLEKLRGLPLLSVEGGGLASAMSSKIFLPGNPGGFALPPFGHEVRLLKLGPEERWRPLYGWLSVQTLSLSSYTTDLLLNAPQWATCEALLWLAAHYKLLDEGARKALHAAALVRGQDGRIHPARDLYALNVEALLLPAGAKRIDLKYYDPHQTELLPFFEWLGLRQEPSPHHLLDRIQELIIEVAGAVDPHTEDQLGRIAQYLNLRWEALRGSGIGSKLRDMRWLPVLRRPKDQTIPGFRLPEDRLFRPSELYSADRIHLLASQAPLHGLTFDAKFRKDLDFPTEPTLELVLRHFEYLLHLWENRDYDEFWPFQMDRSVRQIYQFIGHKCSGQEMASVRQRFAGRRCLWDPRTGRFWLPQHVFAESASYLQPWRTSISGDSAGMDVLGRRREPTVADLVAVLNEIGTDVLPEHRPAVLKILRRLCEADDDLPNDLKVLTQDQQLTSASSVYLNDARWRAALVTGAELALLDEEVLLAFPDIVERTGVQKLSACLAEALVGAPNETTETEAREEAARLQERIRMPEFVQGLRRLLLAQSVTEPRAEFERIGRLRIMAVDQVVVDCQISNTGQTLGRIEDGTFLEEESGILYVAAAQVRRMPLFVARAISRILGVGDIEPLKEILECDLEFINEELDARRVPGLTFAIDGDAPDWQTDEVADVEAVEAVEDDETDEEEIEEAKDEEDRQAPAPRPAAGLSSTSSSPRGSSSRASSPHSGGQPSLPVSSGLPGTGKTKFEYPSGRGRVITYVSSGPVEAADPAAAPVDWEAITRAAHDHVLQKEIDADRQVTESPDHQQRYHLESVAGTDVRHIIILGCHGPWGRDGQLLTPKQHAFALEAQATTWLYVVEHALGPQPPVLHRIRNPVGRITQYRLDEGWKGLAEPDADVVAPKEGMGISLSAQEQGVIEKVDEEFDPLKQLHVRLPGDVIKIVMYDPLQHRLMPSVET